MFLSLLLVTFVISMVVCLIVAKIFDGPITKILDRIISDSIASAWSKYVNFAIYVVGVSGGVRIHYLENFLRAPSDNFTPPVLTADRWVLEIYRTIIGSLQSVAWMLLLFFIFTLIAYVIVKSSEMRANKNT